MARSSREYQFGRRRETYYQATHRPLPCLVFLLPLIVACEVGSLLIDAPAPHYPPQRVIAFDWIVQFLRLFTVAPTFLPGLLLLGVLLVWQAASGHRWRFRWPTLLGMAVESALFCAPLLVLSRLVEVYLAAGPADQGGLGDRLIIALTAGIYEELIFRLLLIWVLKVLLVDVLEMPRSESLALIVLAAALLFAAHHYLGEAFQWRSFLFRLTAGMLLGMIYVLRGFGITVGTHALYDVVITLAGAG